MTQAKNKKLKKIRIDLETFFDKLKIINESEKELVSQGKFKEIVVADNSLKIYVEDENKNLKKIKKFVVKNSDVYEYKTEDNKTLISSNKHKVFKDNKEVLIDETDEIDVIENGIIKKSKITHKNFIGNDIVYDFEIDDPHRYITPNGIIHHNTTVATIALLYDMARTLCLANPQKRFKLPNSAKIMFMVTNSTLENAEDINLNPLISIIRESPFFVSKFSIDQKSNMFQNNIDVKAISSKKSLVGKNVLSAYSDEINVEVRKGSSQEIVVEMINRINSRFLMPGGKWAGIYSLVSSATTEGSLINTLMANEEADRDSILVLNPPRWEVKWHTGVYSNEWFKVFIGDYQSDPFIIKNDKDLQTAEKLDPTKIIDVPIEHKEEFVNDIYAGIRDVIGLAISDSRTFLPFKNTIMELTKLNGAMMKDEIILSENGDDRVIDFFNLDPHCLNPNAERIIGIDIGLSNDRLGISMIHLHDTVQISKTDENSNPYLSEEKVFYVDFAFGIKAPKGEQVPLRKIREFIYDMTKLGVKIKAITMDTFQSYDTIQILKSKGYNALITSVDRKKNPYYTFRNAIREKRIFMPNNEILKKELLFLKEDEKKIDHPEFFPNGEVGTKDIADSICGALFVADDLLTVNSFSNESFKNEFLSAIGKSNEKDSRIKSILGIEDY